MKVFNIVEMFTRKKPVARTRTRTYYDGATKRTHSFNVGDKVKRGRQHGVVYTVTGAVVWVLWDVKKPSTRKRVAACFAHELKAA